MAIRGLQQRSKCAALTLWLALFCLPVQAQEKPLLLRAVNEALAVQLSDGRTVLLEAVVPIRTQAPSLPPDWQDAPIVFERSRQNRYGEQIGWLRRSPDGALLQNELMKNGAAMAYWPKDTPALPEDWLSLDAPPSAQFSAQEAAGALGRWARIEGVIHHVSLQKNDAYLNFAENWREDFTIYLPKQTRRKFDDAVLRSLEGKRVAVRGYVHSYLGPRVTLFNPAMLEIF